MSLIHKRDKNWYWTAGKVYYLDGVGLETVQELQKQPIPVRLELMGIELPELRQHVQHMEDEAIGDMRRKMLHCIQDHAGTSLNMEYVATGEPVDWHLWWEHNFPRSRYTLEKYLKALKTYKLTYDQVLEVYTRLQQDIDRNEIREVQP